MSARVDMRQTRASSETIADGRTFYRIDPPPLTKLSPADWCAAVSAAACNLSLLVPPTALEILWAQYALETGRGSRCYGFNLGNVMRPAGAPVDWCELGTFEWLDPDGAGPRKVERVDTIANFACYATAQAGARAYLEVLRGRKYAPAFAAALTGSPVTFARELRARGYYTAPEDQYAGAVASLAREARAALAGLEVAACEVPDGLWPVEFAPVPATWPAASPIRASEGEHTIRTIEEPL